MAAAAAVVVVVVAAAVAVVLVVAAAIANVDAAAAAAAPFCVSVADPASAAIIYVLLCGKKQFKHFKKDSETCYLASCQLPICMHQSP